jgi:SAM-dependent methyltransferase
VDLRASWQEQSNAWAAWARTPDFDYFFRRFNMPCFLDILPPSRGLTLEIGCGEGRVARILSDRGYRMVGVDGSPTLAHLTATHEAPQPVAIADAAALPIPDDAVSLAVAFMVLQDVDDLEAAVREAARVLVPGGRLCLAIVHPIASAGDFADEEDEDSPFVIERLYTEPTRLREPFERDGLSMVFHSGHRPLATYFAALEDAGFVVEALREPVPDDDVLGSYPRMRRQRRVPWFLHVRARATSPEASSTG